MTNFVPRSWIHIFKGQVYENVLLEVPASFVEYLKSDSIFDGDDNYTSQLTDSEDENNIHSKNENENEIIQNTPSPQALFPKFYESVEKIIQKFESGCIAKLCCSSPKDSTWLTPDNSLRCRTISQILHLLKASDRVSLELSKSNDKLDLLMIKWDPFFDPSMEFRAFIRNDHIFAICQRNDTVYYPQLSELSVKIKKSAKKYVRDVISPKAPWRDCKFKSLFKNKKNKFPIEIRRISISTLEYFDKPDHNGY